MTSKTIAFDLPDRGYLEITATERDGSDGLSPGFSITGDRWGARVNIGGRARKRQGWEPDASGMLREEILWVSPELRPVIDVHLADPTGLPMHAKANGWYFYTGQAAAYEREKIAHGEDYGYSRNLRESDHVRAAKALHIDPTELPADLDEHGFSAFVNSLAERYRAQAQHARELLDSLIDGDGIEPTT